MRHDASSTRTITISTAMVLALIALASAPEARGQAAAMRHDAGRVLGESPAARMMAAAVAAVARDFLAARTITVAAAICPPHLQSPAAASPGAAAIPDLIVAHGRPLSERLTDLPPPAR